jgi:hypothetical protein
MESAGFRLSLGGGRFQRHEGLEQFVSSHLVASFGRSEAGQFDC